MAEYRCLQPLTVVAVVVALNTAHSTVTSTGLRWINREAAVVRDALIMSCFVFELSTAASNCEQTYPTLVFCIWVGGKLQFIMNNLVLKLCFSRLFNYLGPTSINDNIVQSQIGLRNT